MRKARIILACAAVVAPAFLPVQIQTMGAQTGMSVPLPQLPIAAAISEKLVLHETSYFSISLPEEWIASDHNDFGAALTLSAGDKDARRSIDIYRECIEVLPEARAAFANTYASSLEPKGQGAIISQPRMEHSDNHDFAAIELSLARQPGLLQEYVLFFSEDGLFTIVLTTRADKPDADKEAIRRALDSFKLKDNSKSDAAAIRELDYSFVAPKGWAAKLDGGELTLTPPVSAAGQPVLAGLPVLSGLRVSMIAGSASGEAAHTVFIRDFRAEVLKRFAAAGEGAVAARVTEKAVERTGGEWRELDMEGTHTAFGSVVRQHIAVLFGASRTYSVTFTAATGEYETYKPEVERFLESMILKE